jgi:hypothetical protein
MLSLKAAEIDVSFEQLSSEAVLKMASTFVKAQKAQGNKDMKDIETLLEILNKQKQGKKFTNDELTFIANQANRCDILPEKYVDYYDEDNKESGGDLNVSKMLNDSDNQTNLTALLPQILSKLPVVNLQGLGNILPGIHAMARGAKSVCKIQYDGQSIDTIWDNNIVRIKPKDFSLKVQGSLDRKAIANSFYCDANVNDEIKKKVRWLQEWIQDTSPTGATIEDIENFLKFASGSSSLASGQQIRFSQKRGSSSPMAIAHTCFHQIELSPNCSGSENGYNDFNKEAFIRCVREGWFSSIEGYQMR